MKYFACTLNVDPFASPLTATIFYYLRPNGLLPWCTLRPAFDHLWSQIIFGNLLGEACRKFFMDYKFQTVNGIEPDV